MELTKTRISSDDLAAYNAYTLVAPELGQDAVRV
jgi:hypothetical protein